MAHECADLDFCPHHEHLWNEAVLNGLMAMFHIPAEVLAEKPQGVTYTEMRLAQGKEPEGAT